VNVFVAPAGAAAVLTALPGEVVVTDDNRRGIERDGQARLWWDDTPVDLFFDVHDFHREVGAAIRLVSFLDRTVPVLACTDLVVFKAMFNRTKDWADIEEMIEAGTVDGDRALLWLCRLLGRSDEVTLRLATLVHSAEP
jgi:hypothetical protein